MNKPSKKRPQTPPRSDLHEQTSMLNRPPHWTYHHEATNRNRSQRRKETRQCSASTSNRPSRPPRRTYHHEETSMNSPPRREETRQVVGCQDGVCTHQDERWHGRGWWETTNKSGGGRNTTGWGQMVAGENNENEAVADLLCGIIIRPNNYSAK